MLTYTLMSMTHQSAVDRESADQNTAATTPCCVVVRISRSHVQPQCSCGWLGVLYPIRTVEGWSIAEQAANDHMYAHEHGLGWFDYEKGWVQP